jgi:hypothetical protein
MPYGFHNFVFGLLDTGSNMPYPFSGEGYMFVPRLLSDYSTDSFNLFFLEAL